MYEDAFAGQDYRESSRFRKTARSRVSKPRIRGRELGSGAEFLSGLRCTCGAFEITVNKIVSGISLLLALGMAGAAYYHRSEERSELLILPVPIEPQAQPQLPGTGQAPPLSSLFLPVSIPISDIRESINQEVPLIFHGVEVDPVHHGAVIDDHLAWQARRGPIAVDAWRGGLWLTVGAGGTADVRGKVRPVRGRLGKILRRASGGASDIPFAAHADVLATLSVLSRPELLPDWRIRPNINSQLEVHRAEVPIAGITRVDVRPQVSAALRNKVRRQLERLEQRVLGDDRLFRLASREWQRLHKVERLTEDPAAWLVVRPVSIEASRIIVDKDELSLGMGIYATTQVLVADAAPENRLSPLPRLTPAEPRKGLLKLNTWGHAPWRALNQALSDRLKDHHVYGANGTSLVIREATLAPWADGVLLTLDLDAKRDPVYRVSGTLYLTARPRLDVRGQRLYLDDLDFALETKDTLASLASWIMQTSILEALEQRAVLDLSDHVERATAKAEQAIDRFVADMPRGVKLTANVRELAVSGLSVTPEFLQVLVQAEVEVTAAVSMLVLDSLEQAGD